MTVIRVDADFPCHVIIRTQEVTTLQASELRKQRRRTLHSRGGNGGIKGVSRESSRRLAERAAEAQAEPAAVP
jgi:hypothetical protein